MCRYGQRRVSRGVCVNMDKKDNGNIIECIYRRYRVHTPDGMIIEVESTKHLSEQINRELLEEDGEIDTFFSNHKIMNMSRIVSTPSKIHQERDIANKLIPKKGKFSPVQRFNNLLKMKGEFTRDDYRKHMSDIYGVDIGKYMAYEDIGNAIASKRLEIVGRKDRLRLYKVVDPTSIDDNLYKSLLRDRKIHISTMQ